MVSDWRKAAFAGQMIGLIGPIIYALHWMLKLDGGPFEIVVLPVFPASPLMMVAEGDRSSVFLLFVFGAAVLLNMLVFTLAALMVRWLYLKTRAHRTS
jgi:hypothetical protein